MTWPKQRSLPWEMLDSTSFLLSDPLLLYLSETQCKLINSTLLLVAACMVCILSIRKTVNPAHLFTLPSQGILHAHVSTGNYWHGLLDHEKLEAYGKIRLRTDCFFSSERFIRISTIVAYWRYSARSWLKLGTTYHSVAVFCGSSHLLLKFLNGLLKPWGGFFRFP